VFAIFVFVAGIFFTIFLVTGIHETGHFLAARFANVGIERFSFGFGPVLFARRDKRGTEYALSLIPLGGYVKLLDEESNTSLSEKQRRFAFSLQPFWKKFVIIAAGPLFNLLFALLLYWIIFMAGFTSILPVADIAHDSIAAHAGLAGRIEITAVDGKPVASWTSVIFRIIAHTGDHDTLLLESRPFATSKKNQQQPEQHLLDLGTFKMDELNPDPTGSLGLIPWLPKHLPAKMLHHNQYGPYDAFRHAMQNTTDITRLNADMMIKLFTGKLSLKSLGGPVSIFSSAGHAFSEGAIVFMAFLAYLNIAIGVLNIAPIPGLDGGHLLLQGIEAVSGRRISPRTLTLAYKIGFAIIFIVAVQAIVNDILRL
jgi:regulator of sigma E protease